MAERVVGEVVEGHKGCAIEVPFDPAERFGRPAVALRAGRRGHRVRVDVAGVVGTAEIVPRMRRFWLRLDDDLLACAGLTAGDVATVDVDVDVD